MIQLLKAIETIKEFNELSLREVANRFAEYSGQTIPDEAINDFNFTGLDNVDFLTSDWLNGHDLKNLYQIQDNRKIKEWYLTNFDRLPGRVMDGLIHCIQNKNMMFMHEVTKEAFIDAKGVSSKAWSKFIELREKL